MTDRLFGDRPSRRRGAARADEAPGPSDAAPGESHAAPDVADATPDVADATPDVADAADETPDAADATSRSDRPAGQPDEGGGRHGSVAASFDWGPSRTAGTPSGPGAPVAREPSNGTSPSSPGGDEASAASDAEHRGTVDDHDGAGSPEVVPLVDTGGLPIRRWDVARGAELDDPSRRPRPLEQRTVVAPPEPEDDDESAGHWYEIPVMLVLAFTLAFLLRTFVVQVFWIPSGSMVDTLLVNDRIAVEKVSYRFGDVDRGDVIVFAGDEPFGAGTEQGLGERILVGFGQFLGLVPVDAQDFVKRVIGLPGDFVEIVDGTVSVNGVELDEPYAIPDASEGTWDVPDGQLFVMGDNRPNSGDSRTALGYIDVDDVVGRATAKIWPPSRIGGIETTEDWDPIPDPG